MFELQFGSNFCAHDRIRTDTVQILSLLPPTYCATWALLLRMIEVSIPKPGTSRLQQFSRLCFPPGKLTIQFSTT